MDAARDAFIASIQRDLNSITDADRSTRRRAFDVLSKRCVPASSPPTSSDADAASDDDRVPPPARRLPRRPVDPPSSPSHHSHERRLLTGDATAAAPGDELLQALAPALFPTLLRGLKDPVEKVREKCATLVTEYVARLDDAAPALKSLMPALAAVVGVHPVEEPSEEIRLMLVELAHAAARKSGVGMTPFVEEFVAVVVVGARDQFHDVKKAVCAAIRTVAGPGGVPRDVLSPRVKTILAAILPDCQHRHSQVRLAALSAASALFPAATPLVAAETLAPGVRPLCADRTPAVRAAFHAALADWLTAEGTPNRSADEEENPATFAPVPPPPEGCALRHAPVFLPMLLTGVADETDANGRAALALVERVGLANDAALGAVAETADGVAETADGASFDASTLADLVDLPPPFDGAPHPAARRLVRALVDTILPAALSETREWTASQRNAGARLLGTTLAFARDAATPRLPSIISTCVAAVSDDDRDTAERVVTAARLVGAYASPRDWIPLCVDAFAAEKATPAQRASALVVVAAATRGAPMGSLAGEPIATLAEGLACARVRGCDHDGVRAQSLNATVNAIRAGGDACAAPDASRNLFRTLLDIKAAETRTEVGGDKDGGGGGGGGKGKGVGSQAGVEKTAGVESAAAGALEELARACGFANRGALFAAHASSTLATLAAEEPGWEGDGPGPRAFRALVLGAPAEVIGSNLDGVVSVLVGASRREREPAVRLAALRTVDAAFEDENVGAAMTPAIETLLTRCVCENLVWRAGKTAAAVRYAAVIALGTILSRIESPGTDTSPPSIARNAVLRAARDGELFASVASAMEEEYFADTRFAACVVMGQMVLAGGLALTDEQRRFVYPELLKRMDDSRDEIRIAAAGGVRAFFRAAPKDYDETNVGYLLKGFVVHMDDANVDVQEATCGACEVAAEVKTEATREAMLAARNTHRHTRFVDRVLAACDAAERKGRWREGRWSGATD